MANTLANGISIAYEVHGTGEPLLLVMGLGGQLISWPMGFVGALVDAGFQVITFDNRDIGLSTKMTNSPPSTRQLMIGMFSPKRIPTEYHGRRWVARRTAH
jgi:pimeloyl-ACP methyl ester carboxylesterase